MYLIFGIHCCILSLELVLFYLDKWISLKFQNLFFFHQPWAIIFMLSHPAKDSKLEPDRKWVNEK